MALPVHLYGRKSSLNVLKVIWILEELKAPYTRTDAGLQFELNKDNPKYRALNPNGLVPTIDDNGFILWESNTIVRYLARKFQKQSGSKFISDEPQLEAEQEKWMDWASTTVIPPLTTVFWQLIRTPPEKQDLKAADAAVVSNMLSANTKVVLNQILKVLENHFADGKKFIVGDFSVADVPIGCILYRWFNMKIERDPMPALAAYYERLTQREAFKTHVMIGLS